MTVTVVDLRLAARRAAEPLDPGWRTRALSLDEIESGGHGLSAADGPLLLICEHGMRSALGARLLRADGLDARAVTGGLEGLRRDMAGREGG